MDSEGNLYFTDPRYGNREGVEMYDANGKFIEGVYRISVDGNVSRVLGQEIDAAQRNCHLAGQSIPLRRGERQRRRGQLTQALEVRSG